ncbi:LytTR family transcriptional regulator DNA-binding domain-containing protein [Donghicola mangrovi]|uniref:LytTR family transcriptional regulator n=1 Tax=Donghicola mangrovi TaxID=2729614 RepID=A0A850Q5M7_9RHOB|nr:LytTR family transcriptional regulator [Donghicola mangrovi]
MAKLSVFAIVSGALRDAICRMHHPAFRVAMLIAPLVLTVVGPFRSDIYNFWHALLLWALVIWVSTVVGMVNRSLVDRLLPRLNFLMRGGVSAVIFGAYLTPIMRLFSVGSGIMREEYYPTDLEVFLTAALGSFSVAAVRFYIFHAPEAQSELPSAPAQAPIFDRIAATRFDQIIRMTVDDHYVEIVTDLGQERILMRFADAIREMGEGNGLLVHRSHWVNPTAVTGCRREGIKVFLMTRDGAEVPVSKTYRENAISAGLIEG